MTNQLTADAACLRAGPLRVCFVTERYPPQPGGVSIAAQRVVGYLTAAGMTVTVVHPMQEGGSTLAIEQSRCDGADLLRVRYPEWNEQSAVAVLRLIIGAHRQNPFDIFHAFFLTVIQHCTLANQYCAPAIAARPVIASVRGNDALEYLTYPYWRQAIADGLRNAAWITSVNHDYLRRICRELNIDVTGRSSVIRNGIARSPDIEPWRLTDGNRGTVGTVGAFRMVKDIPLLVRGYAGIPAPLRKRLLLAGSFEPGDWQEEQWSQTLIREFGIVGETHLTGPFPHSDVGLHLRSMHLYAQTSAYEGLPNSLLEAAVHGVPIVATAVGGVAEILTDGETGLLVPHGDPQALATAFSRVLRDDGLARHLSAGAGRLAAEFDAGRERQEWIALYQKLTAKAT